MEDTKLTSWSDFEAEIQKLNHLREQRERDNHRTFGELLFRGLGRSEWGLETTLERSYPLESSDETTSLRQYYRKIAASKPAVEMITGKRWDEVPNFPEFERKLQGHHGEWLDLFLNQHIGIYEYLIYLRHHGFPSPLLDWTASPYVAAFFAFDAMDRSATHVSVYALLRDSMTSHSSDAHLFIVGPYVRSDPRHYAQQSRYSLSVKQEGHDYHFLPHEQVKPTGLLGAEGELVKFNIEASKRSQILRHLDLMNINSFSLFGSEDSLIRTVARRECLFRT